jgi:hypothetical protein
MESGWDPEVKKYFRKIINSIFLGMMWLMSGVTAGLYFGLAYRGDISIIYNILYYVLMAGTLALLLRYLYRTWK